jgi:hypothetical protein
LISWRPLLFAAAALALICELMVPPVVGVADNGDFGKLLGRFGVGSGRVFEYANTRFYADAKFYYRSGFTSSELLLVVPAVAVGRAFSGDGSLDLRAVGAIHAAVFLAAVALFLRLVDDPVFAAAALLLFCDFLYVGYLNSFYMDPAAWLFTILAAVFYLRAIRFRRLADTAALFIAMLLAVFSKPQYAVLGPWFALLFWLARAVLCGGRKWIAAGAAAALLIASWTSYRFFAPPGYAAMNVFTVIFKQILPNTADPERALTALGLDSSFRRWSGLQAYEPGSPAADPAFCAALLQRTSYRKIGQFYLMHPDDAWRALRTSLDEAGSFRSPLGNFDSESGRPPAAQYDGFSWISRVRGRLFYGHGTRLFVTFTGIGLLAMALVYRRRKLAPGAAAGVVVLAGMAFASLLISALADVFDQTRHHLVSFALFDLLLLAALGLTRKARVPKSAPS